MKYNELNLSFWDGTDKPYPIPISYFVKNADNDRNRIGTFLATMLTKMVKLVDNPINAVWEEYDRIFKEKGCETAIQYAKQAVKDDPNAGPLYVEIAKYSRQKGDYEDALFYANEGIKVMQAGSSTELLFRVIRGEANEKLGNFDIARRDLYYAYALSTDDMKSFDDETKLEDAASFLFNKADEELSTHFLERPYKDRKVIMPVERFARLDEIDAFTMLGINGNTGITYPIGHPVANQLYVGHPYIASKYIPFETYQLELVEDKVREFCYLAQCLGAKEISIECLNSQSNDRSRQLKGSLNGKGSSLKVGGSVDYDDNNNMHMIEELSRSISLHQTYVPCQTPFLPTDMVWYPNEPSWQRLYVQRMNGVLASHEERIETRKNQVVNSSELAKLKADVSTVFAGLELEMSSEEESKYIVQENAVLAIKVKFASLNEIQANSNNVNGGNVTNEATGLGKQTFTKEEQEYIQEFEECLAESDGTLSNSERRLLNKLRQRLGITEMRAAQIEASIVLKTAPATDEEREYVEEVKVCLADGGRISSGERRLLDKLSVRLGISKVRAEELERSICV